MHASSCRKHPLTLKFNIVYIIGYFSVVFATLCGLGNLECGLGYLKCGPLNDFEALNSPLSCLTIIPNTNSL